MRADELLQGLPQAKKKKDTKQEVICRFSRNDYPQEAAMFDEVMNALPRGATQTTFLLLATRLLHALYVQHQSIEAPAAPESQQQQQQQQQK